MIVVLDTNIWVEELALNSSLGAAVRFFLKKQGARLAVPEVVRLEVEHNFREKLKKLVDDVRKSHRQLLAVFGTLKEIVLPDEAEIQNKVANIFDSVGVELLDVSFSFESAKSSFLKTIEKLPPSHQGQQFKDGVLWADCVSLLQQDHVLFVTNDTDFFKNKKYNEGLAQNLYLETAGQPNELKIISSLKELLENIKTEIKIDDDLLLESFMETNDSQIDSLLKWNGFCLEDEKKIKKTLYVTEDPNILFVDFSVDVNCIDLTDEKRSHAVLHLGGNGSFNLEYCNYSNMRFTDFLIDFTLKDGTMKNSGSVILGAFTLSHGHKDVVHSPRYNLTSE